MKSYYHVAPADHQGPLMSLAAQHGEMEAIALYEERWPEAGALALNGHAAVIHMYDDIEAARKHKDVYGGKIYAIDAEALEDDYIDVRRDGLEFDHPVCGEEIGEEYLEGGGVMEVTMQQIADAINKPASTVYRWRKDNKALFQAVREYAARQHQQKVDKPQTND